MGWGGDGGCTPRPPIRPQPASERLVLIVVFLGLLLDLLAFTLLLPLLPGLLESHSRARDPVYGSWQRGVDWFATTIGMPAEQRYNSVLFGGLIGSAFSLLQFFSAPLTGAASDCLGRRPVMLLTLTGLATSYAVWATSRSFAAFLASRVIGGISKGNVSLSTAIVADLGSPPARNQGMRRYPRRNGAEQPTLSGASLLPLPLPVLGPGVHPQLPHTPALPLQQPAAGQDVFLHRPHHGHHTGHLCPPNQPWQRSYSCEAGGAAAGAGLPPHRLGSFSASAGPGAAALLLCCCCCGAMPVLCGRQLWFTRAEGHSHGHTEEPGCPRKGSGTHGGCLSVLASWSSGLLHHVLWALPDPLPPPAEAEASSTDFQGRVAE